MATSTSKKSPTKAPVPKSRAVLRDVEAGSAVDCAHCGERVKFQAKVRNRQVIANVYTKRVWERDEHYHAACYDDAGKPHGDIVGPLDQRRSPSPAQMAAKLAESA
jgi:hypothetical protein